MASRIAYNFALKIFEQLINFATMFVLDGPLYIPEPAILLCPSMWLFQWLFHQTLQCPSIKNGLIWGGERGGGRRIL